MSKKTKPIEAPHPWEMTCIAVAVKVDENVLAQIDDAIRRGNAAEPQAEAKAYFDKIVEITGKHEHLGMSLQNGMVLILIDCDKDIKFASDTAYQLVLDLRAAGYKAGIGDKFAYIDPRVTDDEHYKGIAAHLPPPDMEREIVRIMNEYCYEWVVSDDPALDMVYYEGELGGGKRATVAVQMTDKALGCGIQGGDMHYSREARKYWKAMLEGLEADIKAWQDDHPGLRKARAQS